VQTLNVGDVKMVHNPEAIIGNYYWHDSVGYYKILSCGPVKPDTSRDFQLECLWHEEKDKIGKVTTFSWVQHMGNGWHATKGEGIIQHVIPSDGRTWMLFNLKDTVHRVQIGEEWIVDLPRPKYTVVDFHSSTPGKYDLIQAKREDLTETDEWHWDFFLEHFKKAPISLGPTGTTCVSCKRDYPYATAAANFECWGCKNGY
jgi:hypothetical protein